MNLCVHLVLLSGGGVPHGVLSPNSAVVETAWRALEWHSAGRASWGLEPVSAAVRAEPDT